MPAPSAAPQWPEPGVTPRLASEHLAGTILPRVLTSFDLGVVLVAVTLSLPTVASLRSAGPAALGWWTLAFVLFFVPAAVTVRWLSVRLPGQVSIYLWTHRAFGPFWGFAAGFAAWWSGVLALIALAPMILGNVDYLLSDELASLGTELQGVAVLAVIALSGLIACGPLRKVQTVVNVSMICLLAVIVLVLAAAVAQVCAGHPAAIDPTHPASFAGPPAPGLNGSNWIYFSLAVLSLAGVHAPFNLAAEVKATKVTTRYVRWASLVVTGACLTATWALMVTTPPGEPAAARFTAIPEAVSITFGRPVADVAAALVAGCTLMTCVVFQYSFSRLPFVLALDRGAPAWLARLNRHRVPNVAVWAQTINGVVLAALVFVVLPVIGPWGTPEQIRSTALRLVQATVGVTWCLVMLIAFAAALRLSRRPEGGEARPAPRALRLCCVLGVLSCLAAVAAVSSRSWTWLTLAGIGVGVLQGGVLYLVGRRVRRAANIRMMLGSSARSRPPVPAPREARAGRARGGDRLSRR